MCTRAVTKYKQFIWIEQIMHHKQIQIQTVGGVFIVCWLFLPTSDQMCALKLGSHRTKQKKKKHTHSHTVFTVMCSYKRIAFQSLWGGVVRFLQNLHPNYNAITAKKTTKKNLKILVHKRQTHFFPSLLMRNKLTLVSISDL